MLAVTAGEMASGKFVPGRGPQTAGRGVLRDENAIPATDGRDAIMTPHDAEPAQLAGIKRRIQVTASASIHITLHRDQQRSPSAFRLRL